MFSDINGLIYFSIFFSIGQLVSELIFRPELFISFQYVFNYLQVIHKIK